MATGLPPGWECRHSNSRNLPYYFNPSTKESHWEPPPGTDNAALNAYLQKQSTSSSSGKNSTSDTIRCAHLLVKHRESRRPSSWRQDTITRTKDEAYAIIGEYERRIKEGETTLSELATTESDDSSARKGGDLGFFGRGMMQAEFEGAAFALKVGEMSPVVSTASGLHLIERIE